MEFENKDLYLIAHCLDVAARQFTEDAQCLRAAALERLAEQFDRQAADATVLRDRLAVEGYI